jgi:hypothetical protein
MSSEACVCERERERECVCVMERKKDDFYTHIVKKIQRDTDLIRGSERERGIERKKVREMKTKMTGASARKKT